MLLSTPYLIKNISCRYNTRTILNILNILLILDNYRLRNRTFLKKNKYSEIRIVILCIMNIYTLWYYSRITPTANQYHLYNNTKRYR